MNVAIAQKQYGRFSAMFVTKHIVNHPENCYYARWLFILKWNRLCC